MRTGLTKSAAAALRQEHVSVAVVVAGLHKRYGAVEAVRGVGCTMGHGEVFALLGRNRAGKSTTLEILEGFRARDAGRVEVLGIDPGDRAAGAGPCASGSGWCCRTSRSSPV